MQCARALKSGDMSTLLSQSTRTADAEAARGSTTGWIAFQAHCLFVLAAWTITIKYVFPIAFAAAHGEPVTSHIYWDAWPVAHIWLGWVMLRRPWYTRRLAIGMAVIEITIIVTRFIGFFSDPEWTIWQTNWFINKLFILLCFALILGTFTIARGAVRNDRQALNKTTPQEICHGSQ